MPIASARKRRIAAGAQGKAEGREQDAPQQRDAGAAEGERQIVVGGLAGEPGRRPDAEHAVAAAGEGIPLEDDRPADLGEGQGQHGEVDARQAHAEPAVDHGEGAGDQRRQHQRCFHRQAGALQQQAGGIGAEAEIGGVAERHHAGRAHDEVQADGEQGEAEDVGQQDGDVAVGGDRHGEQQRQPDQGERPGRHGERRRGIGGEALRWPAACPEGRRGGRPGRSP